MYLQDYKKHFEVYIFVCSFFFEEQYWAMHIIFLKKETRKVGCLILKQSSKYIINIAAQGHDMMLYFSFIPFDLSIREYDSFHNGMLGCGDVFITSRENSE